MRRIFVLVLVLMLLSFGCAEQSYIVRDPPEWSYGSDIMDELPAEFRPALERIAAKDAAVAKAKHVYIYPEGDGCWMFCRTKSGVYHAGTFWYDNGETAYALGHGSDIFNWYYFSGERVFYCTMGDKDSRKLYAAIAVDGAPVMLDIPAGINALYSLDNGSVLYGYVDEQGYDYAFLTVRDGRFCEVRAVSMDPAGFLGMSGAQAMLADVNEWYGGECTLVSCLYRSNGVITLNFDINGAPMHGYAWMGDEGLTTMRGWEGEMALDDGYGSACRDVGLEIIE